MRSVRVRARLKATADRQGNNQGHEPRVRQVCYARASRRPTGDALAPKERKRGGMPPDRRTEGPPLGSWRPSLAAVPPLHGEGSDALRLLVVDLENTVQ